MMFRERPCRSIRSKSVLGIVCAIATLAPFVPAASAGTLLEDLGKLFTPSQPAQDAPAVSAHLHGAPLPSAPTAPSEKDFRKIYSGWLDQAIMAHYPAETDPQGAAYLRAALAYLGEGDPSPTLLAQERSFDLQKTDEPALLLFIGVIEPPSLRRLDALKKATQNISSSSYPRFIWFMAAANAGKAAADSKANQSELKVCDELSLKYLAEALADDSFLPSEMAALRWRFNANSTQDLFYRNFDRVAEIFNASPKVDPWLKEYVNGLRYVRAAWKARGTGWSNTVTENGWHDFGDNLASARQHLTKSCELNPHDPAAAADMITVCMGENEEKGTMRSWFDRAVAADFDYIPAYKNFLWGLRPRWLGNAAEMTAFGRECAATGRYDTWVPYEFVIAALDISDDSTDHSALFADTKLDDELLAVLNNYFLQPKPLIPVNYAHSVAAIIAHKAGYADEMKRQLAATNYKPVTGRVLRQLDDLNDLVKQVQPQPSPTP